MPDNHAVLENPFTQAQLADYVLKLLGRARPTDAASAGIAARMKNVALRGLYEKWARLKTETALPGPPISIVRAGSIRLIN